ncbi:hypothetical protein GQ37_014275 [Janthinobacterium sp. BJB1]|nr:hypothetical protein CSQ90_27280 [Janthinobacterium sp. BJB303]PJC98218.1 hypothetical protein GQ37_014275 [Janthinobacterium sp. BJB1]
MIQELQRYAQAATQSQDTVICARPGRDIAWQRPLIQINRKKCETRRAVMWRTDGKIHAGGQVIDDKALP